MEEFAEEHMLTIHKISTRYYIYHPKNIESSNLDSDNDDDEYPSFMWFGDGEGMHMGGYYYQPYGWEVNGRTYTGGKKGILRHANMWLNGEDLSKDLSLLHK